MSEDIKQIVMDAKYARIIEALSEMYNMTLEKATDIFYNSETAELIEDKVADLHCRSEKYLASIIWDEYNDVRDL